MTATPGVDSRQHRLTGAQEGVWYAQALDPGNPIFNTGLYLRFDQPIDLTTLTTAIERTVAEADGLRVGFVETADGPRQVLRPDLVQPVPVIDFSDADDPLQAAQRWMHEDLAREPQLCGDRLFSTALLSCGDQLLWYLSAHHIIADGYAVALITGRAAELYTAMVAEEDHADSLAGNRFRPYAELLADDRSYRSSERYQRDRDHWQQLFTDRPVVRSLTDRTAVTDRRFDRQTGRIDPDQVKLIKDAADQLGIGWPELVVAATAIYLARMTGDPDVVLGMPTMGRLGTPAAAIPAMVVNVPPLRLRVAPELTIADLGRQITRRMRELRRHQRYRYEQLGRDLGLRPGEERLTGPQLNIMPFPYGHRFAGVDAEPEHLAAGPVDDLTICLYLNSDGGFRIDLDTNPRLYPPAEGAAHLNRLIAMMIMVAEAGADTMVDRLDVVPPAEHDQLRRWNATTHPVPSTTLPRLFADQVRRTPDAIAVTTDTGPAIHDQHLDHDRQLRYAELFGRVEAMAAQLVDYGAGPGKIVAVELPRSVELVIALYAVQRAGAAYLPIDPDYPAERRQVMITDADPVCLITADGIMVCDHAGDHGGAAGQDRVLDPAATRDHDRLVGPGDCRPEDPAYVIFTSGSTGRPKGVVVPHRGIVNRLLWMQDAFGLDQTDRVLQKTPASFDVSVWEFFWPLQVGARLVLAEPDGHRDPRYLAELIQREQITTVHFVPSMLEAFLAEPAAAGCTSLRRVICSGEELPSSLVRRFHATLDCALHNLYGPTEASVDVTWWPCPPEMADDPVPIGRPIWNTGCHVLDEQRRPVPIGVTGELYLSGTGLADGYLGRPELTAERFITDGSRMYRTGDLARWRPDGVLEFLGRNDHQVKLRGQRIELGEIESALTDQPGVQRAIVVMREDPVAGQQLVGYLVADPIGGDHQRPDPAALRTALAERLPAHMIPAVLMIIDDVPVTSNGKLDRAALPAPAAVSSITTASAVPRDFLQEQLSSMISEVLEQPDVGVEDNFFDLGGHSLSAARLAGLIRSRLGRDVTLGTVFAHPTAAGLSGALRAAADGSSGSDVDGFQPLLALRPVSRPEQPVLFCLHPAGGLGWSYGRLLRHLPDDLAVYAIQAPGLATGAEVTQPGSLTDPGSITDLAGAALEEIDTVQPSGRYQLLGWSVGGVIAHELAVQLQRRGDQVDLLAMLDAYPGEQWRDLPEPTTTDALIALLFMAGLDADAVHDSTPIDRSTVREALRSKGSAFAALPDHLLDAVLRTVATNARLMREHHPDRYTGDLLFFTAGAPRKESWLTHRAWQPYVTGTISNHEYATTHPGLMADPILPAIARTIAGHLRRS